jgi:tetratricopeptide (TPR) repeat protein
MTGNKVHLRSGSGINRLDTENTEFKFNLNLELDLDKSKNIVKTILAQFGKDTRLIIPLQHFTWSDGSESDLWGYYGVYGEERLLINIEHRWIDPHFLEFTFNELEKVSRDKYPIDDLFPDIVISEAYQGGKSKFAELLVAPCSVAISTVVSKPNSYITDDSLQFKADNNLQLLSTLFWRNYSDNQYKKAINILDELLKYYREDSARHTYVDALKAICYLKSDQFSNAVELFLQCARNFANLGIQSYCDLCVFFAIDIAKTKMGISESIAAMSKIAKQIPNLSQSQAKELVGILNNYTNKVNLGAAVLCRRLVEITLKKNLETQFGRPIIKLVKECQAAGQFNGRFGTGLYSMLMVGKWKGILSSDQLRISKGIKDYGDRIHEEGDVADETDAKYAIEACIRIIRQIETGIKPLSPKFNIT